MSLQTKYYCIYYPGLPGETKCNKLLFVKMKPIEDIFTKDESTIDKEGYVKIKEDFLQYEINSTLELNYTPNPNILPDSHRDAFKAEIIKLIKGEGECESEGPPREGGGDASEEDRRSKQPHSISKRYIVTYQSFNKYNNIRYYLRSNLHYKKEFFGNKRLTALCKKITDLNINKFNSYRNIITDDDCKFIYEFFNFYYNYYDRTNLNKYYNLYQVTLDRINEDINKAFEEYYSTLDNDDLECDMLNITCKSSIMYSKSLPFYFSGKTQPRYSQHFMLNNHKTNIITNFNFEGGSKNAVIHYFQVLYKNTFNTYLNLNKTYIQTTPTIYTLYNSTIYNYNSHFYNNYIFPKTMKGSLKIQYESEFCFADKMQGKIGNELIYLMKTKIYIKKDLYEKVFFSSFDKENNQIIHSEWFGFLNSIFNFKEITTSRFFKDNTYEYLKLHPMKVYSSRFIQQLSEYLPRDFNKSSDLDIDLDDDNIDLLKVVPFTYQKDNIKWMSSIENGDTNTEFSYLCNPKYIKIIDSPFIYIRASEFDEYKHKHNPQNKDHSSFTDRGYIIHFDEKEQAKYTRTIELCGGILSDEVGLGKTLSTISHIVSSFKSDVLKQEQYDANNLIITPNRLVNQWYSEIAKYFDDTLKKSISVIKITTITDIKKKLYNVNLKEHTIYIISANLIDNTNYLNYLMTDDYDIAKYKKFIKALDKSLIKPFHLLVNDKHKKYKDFALLDNRDLLDELKLFKLDNRNKFNIFTIKWNRIVVDEAHEVLRTNVNTSSEFLCFEIENQYSGSGYLKKGGELMFSVKKSDRRKNALFCRLVSNYKWCLTATPI